MVACVAFPRMIARQGPHTNVDFLPGIEVWMEAFAPLSRGVTLGWTSVPRAPRRIFGIENMVKAQPETS